MAAWWAAIRTIWSNEARPTHDGGETLSTKQEFLFSVQLAHARQLRRFFTARARNIADATDLVQEVFLRLLRIDHHESIHNPQAYLYTVASHVLHQHAMRHNVASEVVRFADVFADLRSTEETDPSVELEFEQRFEELGRALEQHSPRGYATLMLHRCDGIPLKEIASRLGVSYSMVKRYLAEALAYCHQQLEKME